MESLVANLTETDEVSYASAVFQMLDRDSQTVKPMMVYPITRVELNEMRDGQIVKARIFVVNDEGFWVEAA
jgi:hypothetical protein